MISQFPLARPLGFRESLAGLAFRLGERRAKQTPKFDAPNDGEPHPLWEPRPVRFVPWTEAQIRHIKATTVHAFRTRVPFRKALSWISMSTKMEKVGQTIKRFLHSPAKVFLMCAVFATVSLLTDGILYRLWGLRHDHARTTAEIADLQTRIASLNSQLLQARDPSYIERQARDRLDLAGENDLVFIFPDE